MRYTTTPRDRVPDRDMDIGERTPPRANEIALFGWLCSYAAPPFLWTSKPVRSENTMLLNNTKVKFLGTSASGHEINAGVIVFRCKNRFASLDKGPHLFLQAIEEVIFDDSKIKMVD